MSPSSTRRSNLDAVSRPKGRLRRLLDVWGFVPGFDVPFCDVSFRTRDGVRLTASYLPGPADPAATPAVIVLHGFGSHRRKPAYAFLAERLSRSAAVLTVDLRGHGQSGGWSTLGLAETLEATAAAAWLRNAGHPWVGIVGISMGATAALRAAGTATAGTYDAVCTISAVARWGQRDTPAMRQLTKAVTIAAYRQIYRTALGVRIAPSAWPDTSPSSDPRHWPLQPVEAAERIARTPLLIVHGVDDHYFGPDEAVALQVAAGPAAQLWLEPAGFGHAEDGLTPAFVERLCRAVDTVVTTGAWPEGSGEVGTAALQLVE